VIESIKQYGYVKERPIIGISYQFIDQSVASYYRVPSGFYVAQINSENAERAGLEQGDVITKLDDTKIASYEDLVAAKKKSIVGEDYSHSNILLLLVAIVVVISAYLGITTFMSNMGKLI